MASSCDAEDGILNVSEWVNDFCLTPSEHFFSHIMARTRYLSMWWGYCPLYTPRPCLISILLVLDHWNNSPQVDMSPHSDTSWFRVNQSLLFLLNAARLVEKQSIPFLQSLVVVTGVRIHDAPHLRRARYLLYPRCTTLEASTLSIILTMHHTRGEHAIYYTTDEVWYIWGKWLRILYMYISRRVDHIVHYDVFEVGNRYCV